MSTDYINRSEFDGLTDWQKRLLMRWGRRYGAGYPPGRPLALASMKFNKRYSYDRIDQRFINWLYTY